VKDPLKPGDHLLGRRMSPFRKKKIYLVFGKELEQKKKPGRVE